MRTRIVERLGAWGGRAGSAAVARGVPPSWLGWRWVRRQTVVEHCAGRGDPPDGARCETVHPQSVSRHALPLNVARRDKLPGERGWWGFSFRDVPTRVNGPTFVATLRDCTVVWYRDPDRDDDFFPAILSRDGVAVDLREIRFRERHAEVLRRSGPPRRLRRATWIAERVYHNYSHWLTAHVPKLLLLRDRGALADALLPPERTAAIDGSLRLAGLDPGRFPSFDPSRPLRVDELTVVGTDRFRPELLRLVPQAYGATGGRPPRRRVFISRARAARRRLANEDEVWALLEPAGFERVHTEGLTFEEQVALMRETSVLCALHGAGLANMLFCPPGAHVIEIADPAFPNPNFYATAAALGHHYWLLAAEPAAATAAPPGWRDLRVDPGAVRALLPGLDDRLRLTVAWAGR